MLIETSPNYQFEVDKKYASVFDRIATVNSYKRLITEKMILMPTLPVRRTTVQMNGDDHTFLTDDRFNDFANQAFGYLSSDLSPENVFHVIELACAYEYDCTQADISGKPEKWVVE